MIIEKAINAIRPGCFWSLRGSEAEWVEILEDGKPSGKFDLANLEWQDVEQSKPLKDELEPAILAATQEIISTEHQRLRAPEYPPLTDLADALYHQSQGDETKMTAYLAAVEAVKQKYPKGV